MVEVPVSGAQHEVVLEDQRRDPQIMDRNRLAPAAKVTEEHLAISPVVLGSGEHLLAGIDLLDLGYRVAEHRGSEAAMHVVCKRT